MTPETFWKIATIWIVLAVLAIANGALREKVFVPSMGATAATLVSGITLSMAILFATWFSLPWYGPLLSSHYWLIGLLWVLATMLFEVGIGHFVTHQSWQQMRAAYNPFNGNLWVVVLAATFTAPRLAAWLRGMA